VRASLRSGAIRIIRDRADVIPPEAMYLESIALSKTLPCLAEPGKIIVVGCPSRPLNEVLPYLATLPSVIAFNPATLSLTLRRRPGLITLEPERASITQVPDIEEGVHLLSVLCEAINATWEHRHELVAVTASRSAPRPLDVWEMLPRTNCGRCGEATCMAFAFGLLQGSRRILECQPVVAGASARERLATLQAML
jgi:ArsR family metal-binding transcriptional regulator